jgi:hypothetical protein
MQSQPVDRGTFDTNYLFDDLFFDEWDSCDGALFSDIGSGTATTNRDPTCLQEIDVGAEIETVIHNRILPVDDMPVQSQLQLYANTSTAIVQRRTPDEVDVPVVRKWKLQKVVVEGSIDTGNQNTDKSTNTGMNAFNAFMADCYPDKTTPWIQWTDRDLAPVIAAFAEQMVQQDGSEYSVGTIKTYITSIQRYINDLRHNEFQKNVRFEFIKVRRVSY